MINKSERGDDESFRNPSVGYLNESKKKSTSLSQNSSRRSKNAMIKITRLKRAYENAKYDNNSFRDGDEDDGGGSGGGANNSFNDNISYRNNYKLNSITNEDVYDENDKEAKDLMAWTNDLNLDDDLLKSPRLVNK
jgi:hypothetical protein